MPPRPVPPSFLPGLPFAAQSALQQLGVATKQRDARALVFGDTMQLFTPDNTNGDLVLTLPDPWVTPTLSGAWTQFPAQTAQYRVGYDGRVYGRGAVRNGVIGTSAFTLPSALWPPSDENLPAESNNAYGKLVVPAASGTVVPTVGSNVFFSLASLEFEPAKPLPYVPSCFPIDLPYSLSSEPEGVIVARAVEASPTGAALASPINIAAGGVDWVMSSKGGRRVLTIRNVANLPASKTVALALLAVVGA